LAIVMGQPPSGAVTFLFTDIEGSTRLVKHLRDRYGQVLAEHQSLLRGAFSAHAGHEVGTHGDSFLVVFSSARDALLAAVEGQRALLSHVWPEGVQVKVRMGLHTGQAVVSNGDYTGLAVHRAARICAAGHGGQVLVSQATQTLLEDEEEDLNIFLRDLGEQRLKDLDRPVRLYQAESDGLPAAFPRLTLGGNLTEAAEPAAVPPSWRRPIPLAVAALALVSLLSVAVFVATRGSAGSAGEVHPNRVGVIDPETNEIVAQVPVGIKPGPIAVGDGSVWVGNLQDRTLTRIDLDKRSAAEPISLEGRTPTGIAFGAGALWIAHGRRGQLSRVGPPFDRLSKTIDVANPGAGSGAVDVGAGSVWVVYGDSTLARIDPAATRVAGATFAGASPAALVAAGGSVLVVNAGDETVTRYKPSSYEGGPVGRPIRVGRRPSGIAYGEGAIWVAVTGDDAVTRIDPATSSTSTIPVGDGPTAVAVGGGLVWVANTAAGTVSRIDPVSNEVVKTIKVGNAPSGIVFAGDSVWVTVQAP
jgi:YVTN family beta-propeller protein